MSFRTHIQDVCKATETATRESDDKVKSTLQDVLFGGTDRDINYTDLRAAAQAVLLGQPERALMTRQSRASRASWGSWVEGMPFAHALLFNRGIIVDLVPCTSEKAFVETYKCTPAQFYDIMNHLEEDKRSLFINLRDYDPARPETLDPYLASADVMGSLFLAFQSDTERAKLYLNSVRVKTLLEIFDKTNAFHEIEERLGGTAQDAPEDSFIGQLRSALADGNASTLRATYPQILVRGQGDKMQVPKPVQIFKRTVYHLAFSQICSDIYRDADIDASFSRLERRERLDMAELMALCEKATALHHRYTAPLTGAYGGTYNLTESEVMPDAYRPIGMKNAEHNEAFTDFLYRNLAGTVKADGGALKALQEVSGPVSINQDGYVPTDYELDSFLDLLPESQQFLRQRDTLQDALADSIRRADGDLSNVESYIDAAQKAYKRVNSVWGKLAKKVFVGATTKAGIGLIAVPIGLLGDVARAAAIPLMNTPLHWVWENVVDKHNDAKQIVKSLDSLRNT